jgi:Fe-S cluster assembly protein SufD
MLQKKYSPIMAKNKTKKTSVKNAYNLYFVDGKLDELNSEEVPVTIIDIKEVEDKRFNDYLSKVDTDLKADFAFKFNSAFLANGIHLSVNKNSKLTKPIAIHHHITEEGSQLSSFNIFHIEEAQQLEFIEIFTSDVESFSNPATLVFCEKNSMVEHVVLQDCNMQSLFLSVSHSSLMENATYSNICFHLGAKQSRSFLTSTLEGDYATTSIHGLYPLVENQHHDTLAKIHHLCPSTFSHQLYKGILSDESKGIFTGKILVEREAQLTEAKQLNKNLLLSPKAHAFSRPQLEIYADDVKCAHGSTTGQLSEEELFYFEARGIKKSKARQMLAKAFAYDVVLKIKSTLFRKIISQKLATKQWDIS